MSQDEKRQQHVAARPIATQLNALPRSRLILTNKLARMVIVQHRAVAANGRPLRQSPRTAGPEDEQQAKGLPPQIRPRILVEPGLGICMSLSQRNGAVSVELGRHAPQLRLVSRLAVQRRPKRRPERLVQPLSREPAPASVEAGVQPGQELGRSFVRDLTQHAQRSFAHARKHLDAFRRQHSFCL